MKEKTIFAFAVSILIFPTVMAAVTCPACSVSNCQCSISDCGSGIIDIYSSATCQNNPLFEYTFTGGNFPWFPATSGSYYMTAFCDDGRTKSICSPVIVGTSTSSQNSETQSSTETFTTTQTSGGGSNTILYVLVIVIIVVIAFIAYRLFFQKNKKKRVDYESLYRKWGR
jgi:hypothetical protein